MSGHCDHCDPEMCTEKFLLHGDAADTALWRAGYCPACAERKLLLVELNRRIAAIEVELAAMSGEDAQIYDSYRPVVQAKLHALRSVGEWIGEGIETRAQSHNPIQREDRNGHGQQSQHHPGERASHRG